jgi:acyl-CoA synthetase (AMP-forming)/AMP-acid ligase II
MRGPDYIPLTMGRALHAAARRDPAKIALRFGAQLRTYEQLLRRTRRITELTVSDLGLLAGQNAAIVAGNSIEYLEVVIGVPEAGVPVATINPRLTTAEIVAVCDDAQARVLFADARHAPQLRTAAFKCVERIIELGPEFDAWLAHGTGGGTAARVGEHDIWTIPYTSGTTGEPKGVMLSHRARLLNFFAKAQEYGCFAADDRFLSITPMNHGPGLSFPLNALAFGGTAEIIDKFDPELVLHKLKSGGFTGIFTVPTHFHAFFELGAQTLARYAAPPLKTIISNSAPLPPALKPRIIEQFGEGLLHELYGSTEASLVCNLRPADQLAKPTSVGQPFAHSRVRIVDERGEECPAGTVGELQSTSPYAFSGYWNRPRETAEACRDGWVSVGDLARRDEQGYLYIVDRKKDMVISGGVNLYPREIEEVLAQHPAIAEVAVIGVPDAHWGERLEACVVIRVGEHFTLEDLERFCDGRLAGYKRPRLLKVVERLPRNAAGKVLKTELRRR